MTLRFIYITPLVWLILLGASIHSAESATNYCYVCQATGATGSDADQNCNGVLTLCENGCLTEVLCYYNPSGVYVSKSCIKPGPNPCPRDRSFYPTVWAKGYADCFAKECCKKNECNKEAAERLEATLHESCDYCSGCAGNAGCMNGGCCSEVGTTLDCSCYFPFSGLRCEHKDRCSYSPCRSGSTCEQNHENTFICLCPPDYYGSRCEYYDYCATYSCVNGQCLNTPDGPLCECYDGYLGSDCNTPASTPCHCGPCLNGGTCNYITNDRFTCDCPLGFYGPTCQYACCGGSFDPSAYGPLLNSYFGASASPFVCNTGMAGDAGASGRNAVLYPSLLWTGGIVPYVIHPDSLYNASLISIIKDGMAEIERQTQSYSSCPCIQFVERTDEIDYVEIYDGSGCYSYLGQIGGLQSLSLSAHGCLDRPDGKGVVMHELLHALGFDHEQTRANRGEFICLDWPNSEPDYDSQYTKYDSDFLSSVYDVTSIMHYSPFDTSIDPSKPVIYPCDASKQLDMLGNTLRGLLSNIDVSRIRRLYGCSQY